MKVYSTFLFFFLISFFSNGQFTFSLPSEVQALAWKNDANGKPVYTRDYTNAQGSPDFHDEYCVAIISANGKKYDSIKIKLNLLDNLVLYMDKEEERIATIPVREIEFTGCAGSKKRELFQSGFPRIDRQDASTFYQVLDTGNTMLLKYYKITYKDQQEFNSATTTRYFNSEIFYYVFSKQKEMKKLGTDNASVTGALADKKEVIQAYIATNKIKCKKQEDLIRVVNYYNSINQ